MRHLLIFILVAGPTTTAWCHPGGLQADGCHNDRKANVRHCHPERVKGATKVRPPVGKPGKLGTAISPIIAGGSVKLSKSGICHGQNSPAYSRTLKFTAYPTMAACVAAGGRPAKTALAPRGVAPSSVAGMPVKLSQSGICHPAGSAHYARTQKFRLYPTMAACLGAGGRHAAVPAIATGRPGAVSAPGKAYKVAYAIPRRRPHRLPPAGPPRNAAHRNEAAAREGPPRSPWRRTAAGTGAACASASWHGGAPHCRAGARGGCRT